MRRLGHSLAALAAVYGVAVTADASTKRSTGGLPQGSEPVSLDPADFTINIDNPFWPMAPGNRWVFRGSEGEKIVVTVTDRTRVVDGITTRVVHDVESRNGRVEEDTFDWFAQDEAGNVWYFGEDTTAFEKGKPASKSGSWEAGVGGAQPGVVMPGKPKVGLRFRQEYFKGEAEDRARILSVDDRAEVPAGSFKNVLLTRDDTPVEPDVLEYKLYARGVGPVVSLHVSGGSGREELVKFEKGRR